MNLRISRFRTSEDGAVTVDWVVLTAAIVGLGVAVVLVITGATTPKANNLGQYLKDQTVGG